MSDSPRPLLSVRDLTIAFPEGHEWRTVVDSVSFDIAAGEAVGLVGESGSGKSVTSMALVGLIDHIGGRIMGGSIEFEGRELIGLPRSKFARLRGDRIGVVFQQPNRSLDPAFTVGHQIAETIRTHQGASRRVAWRRAVELLQRVEISKPEQRAKQYPHSLSGGMCQRVMIAMALACNPSLLIADEPTTALDVTVQARILALIATLQREMGIAVLFISHDLAVVTQVCDRVDVMYAGQLVEEQPTNDLIDHPRHPYTAGLLASVPNTRSRKLPSIRGAMPLAANLPPGCRFHPRCDFAIEGVCDTAIPAMTPIGPGRVRCVRAPELELPGVQR